MPEILGPDIKKLIATKMSTDAVPPGGGLESAIAFIITPEAMAEGYRKSKQWVRDAIQVIKEAPEPNPWKAATDEEIAGELLRQIEERRVAIRQKGK